VRIVIVTDALDQPTRGNHTTIQRWIGHIRGAEVLGIPADPSHPFDPVPDVIHGYHAIHGGVAALALARRYQRPLVISLGGTDLWACLQGDAQVYDVLDAAACVTGAFPQFGEMLSLYFDRALAYRTVPRGVPLPDRVEPRAPVGTLRVLLPAGVRPVKDPMLAVGLAERLVERGLPLRLQILGPELDRAYARRVRERIEPLDYVTVDEAGLEEMADVYRGADVVWNTSHHEGGSNTLLEAVAHGCAVFARDIPGNHELLSEDGAPEGLFDPQDLDFAERFHKDLLTETPEQRRARIEAGRAWLRRLHDPAQEARALEEVWQSVFRDS